MTASDHLNGQQFYHGTAHDFSPGDLVTSGRPSNYEGAGPTDAPGTWSEDHTYFTRDPDAATRFARVAAHNSGGTPRVYKVEPTAEFEPTPAERDSFPRPVYHYWSSGPLKVTGEHTG